MPLAEQPRAADRRIIRSKIRPPALAETVVARPRLEQRLRDLVARTPVVAVTGTPGAGKTTAAVQALGDDERLAWLTLDESDVAPGRLLTYLEATLAAVVPAAAGAATGALADGLSHVEAAGLLAESVEDTPVVLVLDEAERIADAPAALTVLDALLRYAPPSARVVLISRRDLPLTGGRVGPPTGLTVVGESELAFTTEEAGEALAGVAPGTLGAEEAVAATGGWVTGVLFEAWRSTAHVAGTGGEADPFRSYLSKQILDALTDAERELLVLTAPLRRVDPETAAQLGVEDARAVLERLRRRHLPVTWEPEGPALRCHPRFREALGELLVLRGEATVRRQRRLHGELLRRWGLHEEAADELFAAGELDAALGVADDAIDPVIERLDLDVADRWLRHVPDGALADHPGLLAAELVVALGREDFARGRRAAETLLARPHPEALPPRTLSLMAWCLWIGGAPDRAREVERLMPPGPERRITRYLLTLSDDEPWPEREAPPNPTGSPLDGLIIRTHVVLGRLALMRDAPPTRWSPPLARPWVIETARGMGRLNEAREGLRVALAAEMVSPRLRGVVAPRVHGDLGRVDEALAMIRDARPDILARASVVWEFQSLLLEARLLLRHDVDRAHASAILAGIAARAELDRYAFLAEEVALWEGLALLLAGDDERARDQLRSAVASMTRGRRILELPIAAVYLAEAAWRLGDEDEADASADLALEAAGQQGSNHALLQALTDFPGVLVRRLDAEPGGDSPWHDLGRILAARSVGAVLALDRHVRFHDLGVPRLEIEGAAVRPQITKSLEALAFLAAARDQRTTRRALMDAVFDGRSDHSTRTYLRQALHKLREMLPAEAEVALDGDHVAISGVTVTTDSARFERMLDEAGRVAGTDRLEALERALALYETGEYLAGRETTWIDERRAHLAELAADARFDAAELRFAANDLGAAQAHLDAVLTVDPYRERAWRLAMRITAAYGDDDRVIAVFRRCERALAEVGIAPSRSTRRLLDGLRR